MNDIWAKLRDRKGLDEELRKEITEAFGKRGTSALGAIDAGRVNVVVGFAPLKPAEFVIITITQISQAGE